MIRLWKFLRPLRPVLTACWVILCCSCSIVPNGKYAELAVKNRQLVHAWPVQADARQAASLTELMYQPELDTLIEEALQANPGLQQTVLALQILRGERRQTAAERLPGAEFSTSREKEEGMDDNMTGSLTISWEMDLWQKLADSESAAGMDVAEQEALLRAAQASLAAEVMQEWLGLIRDQHTIDIEQQRLENLGKNEQFILDRYRYGIGTLEDLDSARSATAVSRASLEEYRESLAERQRSLKTILGRIGTEDIAAAQTYPTVATPLAELPEQTLAQRPDLQAAYFAIEAADLRTAVAYKDLLPSISLEAILKDTGTSTQSMLLNDPVWTMLGQLTAPIFQGGRLRATADVAELEAAQSYEGYRETLLEAIAEVENALGREKSLSFRKEHITTALASAKSSLRHYEESYREGLVDVLDLLAVQENTFDLALQLDNLIYDRLVNRIDLGLALGLGVEQ